MRRLRTWTQLHFDSAQNQLFDANFLTDRFGFQLAVEGTRNVHRGALEIRPPIYGWWQIPRKLGARRVKSVFNRYPQRRAKNKKRAARSGTALRSLKFSLCLNR
jgi:hypothetical protein